MALGMHPTGPYLRRSQDAPDRWEPARGSLTSLLYTARQRLGPRVATERAVRVRIWESGLLGLGLAGARL
jgi:hypothetical protein